MVGKSHKNLAAPCGLYCGACTIYRVGKRGDSSRLKQIAAILTQHMGRAVETKDLVCEGCLSDTVAVQCRICPIRSCAIEKGGNYCYKCPVFPCRQIKDFNNDGMLHHSEVLENIKHQREIGIDAWAEEQAERWRCPKCACALDTYSDKCPDCGTDIKSKWH